MAYFFRVPGGQKISGTTVRVDGTSLTVGLSGTTDDNGNNLVVTDDTGAVSILPAGNSANGKLYKIAVTSKLQASQDEALSTIFATGDLGKDPADTFNLIFRYKVGDAKEILVDDVTQSMYGSNELVQMTGAGSKVLMTTYRPADQRSLLDFAPSPGRPVRLRLFSAKFGSVQRAFWLMLPQTGSPSSLMVVISHGFGQQNDYYTRMGYANPLSKDLLDDILLRFVLWRWGLQVAAARSDMAMIMPVRAHTPGGELGPFASQKSIGAGIITSILSHANASNALNEVNVVAYSSGIYDANSFINVGGHGLNFGLMINQDPTSGTMIAGQRRKQYLSGWTTHGRQFAGFDFIPTARWRQDPQYAESVAAYGNAYVHDWAMPQYTLAMALSR